LPLGKKYGGRKKGTPNKATTAFQREAEERFGKRINMRPNSKDEMRKCAMVLSGLAEQERQKGPPRIVEVRDEKGKVTERRKEGMDPSFLSELVEKAGRMWEKVCNFEWPRLASVNVTHEPLDLSVYTDEELAELERLHAIGRSPARTIQGRVDQTTH
jgi:hypothetical protein